MIVIGLTGSIGMGKSTATDLLRRLGVPVFSSDAAVHRLLGPKGAAVAFVRALFPKTYDPAWGAIDRARLGKIVFADVRARARLEAVLHPLVQQAQQKFIERHRRARAVAVDIPLLFETDAQDRFDHIMVVHAPSFVQRQRVLKRPGMTHARLAAIRAAQWPDSVKTALADTVIETGAGRAETRRALARALRRLLRPRPKAVPKKKKGKGGK